MRRVAAVIGIHPDHIEEYERLHRDVWPAVLDRIAASKMRNYSIFRYGQLLFSYFEYVGDDYETDMNLLAQDQSTQRWWAICGPLQQPVPERLTGQWWHELPEVFHTD